MYVCISNDVAESLAVLHAQRIPLHDMISRKKVKHTLGMHGTSAYGGPSLSLETATNLSRNKKTKKKLAVQT